jgi:porin
MFFPVPNQEIMAITGLKFTQMLTERSGLFVGKLNALNGDREKFLRYPLTARFWNAAFNFNLALDRYPYSTPGAGYFLAPEGGPGFAVVVLDSNNAPRTTGLQNLGSNGAFVYAETKLKTDFLGLAGQQVIGGLYGSGSFSALAPSDLINLPGAATRVPMQTGTWTLLYRGEQRLWTDPREPERGLGVYIQAGLGDGDPNPVRTFVSAALHGNSPLPSRPGDTFGVGYYRIGLSAAAKSAFEGLRDENGFELFYSARLAPGCHIGPDLQVIEPGLAPVDAAVLLGVRFKLDF